MGRAKNFLPANKHRAADVPRDGASCATRSQRDEQRTGNRTERRGLGRRERWSASGRRAARARTERPGASATGNPRLGMSPAVFTSRARTRRWPRRPLAGCCGTRSMNAPVPFLIGFVSFAQPVCSTGCSLSPFFAQRTNCTSTLYALYRILKILTSTTLA